MKQGSTAGMKEVKKALEPGIHISSNNQAVKHT